MIAPVCLRRLRGAVFVPAVVTAAFALAATSRPAQAQRLARDTVRISIEEAVTNVLSRSDEALAADAQVDLADAQVVSARSTALPQLRLASGYTQVLRNARGDIVGAAFNQRYTYTSSLVAQQSLFQGGRFVAASQVAARTERAALANREETRAQLAVATQRVYLNAAYTARIADIQRQNLALADTRLAQAEQLERAGRASRYDLLRARVERSNLEPLVLQAENTQALAELDLRRLLNLPMDTPLQLATQLDPARVTELAEAALADTTAGQVRAAVRAFEAVASARDAAVRVTRADWLPSITASFTYGYLALPRVPGFPSGFERTNGWYPDRNFALNMSWPLFDGLRTKGNIDVAQAQAYLADLDVIRARETAAAELAMARADLQRARAAAGARESTVREAEEAFALASLRFERGIGTQLEVSDAQLALLNARSTEARATFDLYLAVAELARTRGESIPLPSGERIAVRPLR